MEYPIGTKYMRRGKCPKECTVVDVHKTYNTVGELVRTRYVAEHKFCDQTVTDYDVVAASIARGLIDE